MRRRGLGPRKRSMVLDVKIQVKRTQIKHAEVVANYRTRIKEAAARSMQTSTVQYADVWPRKSGSRSPPVVASVELQVVAAAASLWLSNRLAGKLASFWWVAKNAEYANPHKD